MACQLKYKESITEIEEMLKRKTVIYVEIIVWRSWNQAKVVVAVVVLVGRQPVEYSNWKWVGRVDNFSFKNFFFFSATFNGRFCEVFNSFVVSEMRLKKYGGSWRDWRGILIVFGTEKFLKKFKIIFMVSFSGF